MNNNGLYFGELSAITPVGPNIQNFESPGFISAISLNSNFQVPGFIEAPKVRCYKNSKDRCYSHPLL